MFKNDYQGGAYFEIFSAQGKDVLANWKLVGGAGIKKVYEREVKGFIYSLEGTTSTTKMTLPKDSRQTLVLVQHYLIFQSYVNRGQDFSIELGVVDISSNKRRILFSTTQKEVQSTPLHAKVPLNIIKRGMWLNLCLDLVSLVGDLWRGQTFKAVESVCVTATCQLRKIFTMKRPPYETANENDIDQNCQIEFDHIPKQCQFANDVQQETQVINLKKIVRANKLQSSDDSSSQESSFPLSQPMPHLEIDHKPKSQIAFGSKVPYLASKKNLPKRHSAETHSQLTFQKIKHDMSFKPHPPREPSSEKNRRRIRVRNAGHDLNSESSQVSLCGKTHPNSSEEGKTNRDICRDKTLKNKNNSQSANLMEEKIPNCKDHSKIMRQKWPDTKSSDNTSEFVDTGIGPDVPEIQSPRKPIEMDESLCGVIAMLKDGLVMADSELSDNGSSNGDHQSEFGGSELDFAEKKDPVYVFTSFPKSAPECSHSPVQEVDTTNGKSKGSIADPVYSGRGAKPEDDFVSVMNGSDDDDDSVENVSATSNRYARTHSNSATSSRGSSGKSVSSRANIPLPEKGSKLPVHSQLVQQQLIQSRSNVGHKSELANHTIPYDSSQYTALPTMANGCQSSLSWLNRKSLREVSPSNIRKSLAKSGEKPYDSSKYQTADNAMMDSLEERMLASMKRQQDEELALHQRKVAESSGLPVDPPLLANPLYDDSLTTNSDDDTTFNSLKVPLALRFAHNYKEEMKHPSRRSTDTLSSSNPRDWSNVFSPPIVLASEINQQPLQMGGALDGCVDDNMTTDCGVQPKSCLNEKDHDEELQLLYDPVLGYYYDPKSRKYYQLI